MKLMTVLLLAASLQVCARGTAQQVTLSAKNAQIENVLKEIQRQTGYHFVYDKAWLSVAEKVNINVTGMSLQQALEICFRSQPFTYVIKDKTIILQPRQEQKTELTALAFAPAASQELEGMVKDSSGNPIEGATVNLLPGGFASQTNRQGIFRFSNLTPGKYELVITYVGYKKLTTSVTVENTNKSLFFVMQQEVKAMQDVILVSTGYQALPKERATGSFGVISKEQIEKPTSNISSRLIGAVAGLQAKSLDVDGNPSFELRGQTTLTASSGSSPLVVVDGFPIQGDFSSVNPNDVESITVLKDAAAASIWGARAANGVIVIITKSGKKGVPAKIEFSSFVKVSPKMDLDYIRPFASSAETVDYEAKAFNRWGGSLNTGALTQGNLSFQWGDASVAMNEQYLGFLTTDQRDAVLARLKTQDNRQQIKDNLLAHPLTQQYNLSIQGSTERMLNAISLLYESNQSNFTGTQNKKYMLNYRTQVNVAKWLDFNLNGFVQYIDAYNNGASLDEIKYMAPYEMLKNGDGSLTNISQTYWPLIERTVSKAAFPYSWAYNPIQEIQNRNLNSKQLNTRIQAGFVVKIMKGLSFESKFQYELFNTFNRNLYNDSTFYVRKTVNTSASWNGAIATAPVLNVPKGSILIQNRSKAQNYVFRNMVNFSRSFLSKHRVDFVAGTEIQDFLTEGYTPPVAYGYNDATLAVSTFPNGPGGTGTGTGTTYQLKNYMGNNLAPFSYVNTFTYQSNRYFSAFANLAYTLNDKYTLSGSYRTDASNLITKDPKYRYDPFWSIGGSWQLHREAFFHVPFVNKLSLRATYGYNGNVDRSTSFVPLLNLNTAPNAYTNDFTASISSYGNPALRWEKTGTINLGVDYSVLNGALFGRVDVYQKKGKDLLASVSIPSVYGTNTQKINAATMTNKGIEVEIGSVLPVSRHIRWRGNFNLSYNNNKVNKLYVASYFPYNLVAGAASGYYVQGYNANEVWAYRYAGVENNVPVVLGDKGAKVAISNYPTGNAKDFMNASGTFVAPYTLGFINNFEVYDFNISFILTGKFGHKFRRTGFNYPSSSSGSRVTPNKYLSEVVNGDPAKIIPLPINDNETRYFFWANLAPNMDYLVANASHVRLQEVNVSYNLRKHLKRTGIKNAQVFIQGNNLLVLKANKYGEDPEYRLGTIKPQPAYTVGCKLEL